MALFYMIFLYVALFLLYGVAGYLLYRNVRLKRQLKEQDISHKRALAEAGNAIADTLKVAFENIKQHNAKINKLDKKLLECQTRFNRFEQYTVKNIKIDNIKKSGDADKNSLKTEKVWIENENE
jgi:hypothetical protein